MAYDRVARKALWKVMRVYGFGEKLSVTVKVLYEGNTAIVRINRKKIRQSEQN